MYVNEFEEQIVSRLEAEMGNTFKVVEGAGDLQSEEAIKDLARRVDIKPHLIVNVAPVLEAVDTDTTGRVNKDATTIEILVAVSEARSKHIQKRQAIEYVFGTRAALQGYNLTSTVAATTPMKFTSANEEFNFDGICVYSVNFTTDTIVDLDEV